MWLPLYVALHPVRIHSGLLKCHVNPLGNRTCERVEFSFEFFAVYRQTVLKRAFARFVHPFVL